MNYNDDQTEMQQILKTIRGYGAVMASTRRRTFDVRYHRENFAYVVAR